MEVIVRAAWAGIPVVSVPVGVHYEPAERRTSHFLPMLDNTRITLLFAYLLVLRFLPFLRRRPAVLPWPVPMKDAGSSSG